MPGIWCKGGQPSDGVAVARIVQARTYRGEETRTTNEILEDNQARIRNLLAYCRRHFEQRGDLEMTLRYANLLGASAWFAHAGFYALPEMERLLAECAAKLPVNADALPWSLPRANRGGRRWLHVLTTAFVTGGHTRMAERWMLGADDRDVHSCVLLDQEAIPCPDWLVRATAIAGGTFIAMPGGASYLHRAAWLRKLAREGADIVVLHAHPDDPIPSVAFGIPGGPPVWLVNHAAHTFWYGPNIADTVIDFREPEAAMSYRRRYARRVDILPMPLKPPVLSAGKDEYKRRLGIPPGWTVLVTIASAYKFAPFGPYRLPETLGDVVASHGDVALLVVGPSPDDPHWQSALASSGGRIRLCGVLPDLEPYYGAADLFLESSPFGSITAAMDAAKLGIPVVLAPEPLDPILGLIHYRGMDRRPDTNEQYRERLEAFLRDPERRQEYGQALRNSVTKRHDDEAWSRELKRLTDRAPTMHAVGLGDSPAAGELTELDRYWARMQRQDGTFQILTHKFEQFNRQFGGGSS